MTKVSPGIMMPAHEVLSPDEWRRLGRARRRYVPRSSHALWEPPADRPDPVETLEAQARERVPELVPIRHGRMVASPFSYYRGSAAQMAWDLSRTPTTDIRVQCCGDAHLLNFGMFAAPDRRLVFDVNDFDETLPASFDWDVKRLGASVAVAARSHGFTDEDGGAAARSAAFAYRTEMERFAAMRFLDVWYSRINVEDISKRFDAVQPDEARRRRRRAIAKAERRTSLRALHKLGEVVDGEWRIRHDPPVVVRFPLDAHNALFERLRAAVAGYEENLQADRLEVLRRYTFADHARKVVGVGSVGTEALIFLLMGDREDEPLFLQFKEAQPSVLEEFAGESAYAHHGERVVRGQQLTQAAGDPFLGWTTAAVGGDGRTRDYYVRQLRDMKGDMNVPAMDAPQLAVYARLCGWALARAHARTGRAAFVAGYLGSGERFDRAIEAFSLAYADQTEDDHARIVAAVDSGRIAALAEV